MTENAQLPKKRGNPNMVKGAVINPHGRPKSGFQGFKDRLAYWLEQKTVGEIKSLIENPKKWDKLLSVDAMVARRIADACGKSGGADFVAILDRLLGKPALMAELNVTHGLADRLDKAEALLASETVVDAVIIDSFAVDTNEKTLLPSCNSEGIALNDKTSANS